MSETAALMVRLERLEAESAARRILSDYMVLCEHLSPDTPIDALGALFTRDAIWEGRGSRYATVFGRHEGRAAIVAMLGRYCDPPHFAFNAHYLSSERIEADGEQVQGRWLMLQLSTYPSGKSDLRSAELSVRFAREDGAWRIAHFTTTNLFSRAVDRLDDAKDLPREPAQASLVQGDIA